MTEKTIQLEGQAAAEFLRGWNSVRDGYLTGLMIRPAEIQWDPVLELTFLVPNAPEGQDYVLELKGNLRFEYTFSTALLHSQISMVKCLWTQDGRFYLSLDPYDEREDFISSEDGDCFSADWVRLTVERREASAST